MKRLSSAFFIRFSSDSHQKITMAIIGPGDVIDDARLSDDQEQCIHKADAIALSDIRVYEMSRADFYKCIVKSSYDNFREQRQQLRKSRKELIGDSIKTMTAPTCDLNTGHCFPVCSIMKL